MLSQIAKTGINGQATSLFARFDSCMSYKALIDDSPERTKKLKEYLDFLNNNRYIVGNSPIHQTMFYFSDEALRITAELNGRYHTMSEIQELFSLLIGKPVDKTFGMFPPFYTDCGKNITIGKNVFINMGCKFQDQGGITIGDEALIGHNVVMATLNHDFDPEKRASMISAPIKIGKRVWVGANAIILGGVIIGDNSIIAAGSIVKSDVPPNTIVAGIPARVIKKIDAK